MQQLTDEQAIVLSVCTGCILIQPFRHVVEDVERRLGRSVSRMEFMQPEFQEEIRELYRADLMKMVVVKPELIVVGDTNERS